MKLAAVVLAAGLGTRMKSALPKVLHPLGGKPMVQQVIETVQSLKPAASVVVVGPGNGEIRNALKDFPVRFAVQKEPKGTGDAFKAAVQVLKKFEGTLLVVSGDTPLITGETLRELLRLHRRRKEDISLLSFEAEGPHAYGRIIRKGSTVAAIVEDRDAGTEQKKIKEVNSGIYALEAPMVKLLKEIRLNEKKGEYYLTDLIHIAVGKGFRVGAHPLGNERELTGINTRSDLYRAGMYLRDRVLARLLDRGITFMDKNSVFIHPDAEIGEDTVIYPNVHIEGKTVVGNGCVLYPNCRIVDSVLGNGVVVKDSTLVESSVIKDRAEVGPFAHLRPGSVIGPSAKIGNFVEVKKSVIGEGTKASHLSYLGDAEIGNNVNIGAGTITCNYDGRMKHRTVIEDEVFIGSDTQLVAPVRVGKGAYIGAGSTITKEVPSHSLALSRTAQRHIENWAVRRQEKAAAQKPARNGNRKGSGKAPR
ncbi:MAG: bifunctional UDP-N-acetylglucosamine diphosphorylase/glucosamine-1-phosphate N-acetyltransferase GlmU [Alphaproteobacteria bacterium]|uniref:Bifunctional protein GlmU n=1 Tax=Candidatus Nitrobium versatile TaxID=2884831 RepID=A0A953JAT8_9BACT|nr:bifunctional UDP-N-acetylglucosamine diphosphorylase/glucosamine-1-phosphate N-acetyltransferase GlmU [Candidatus Nitrobium versatile]